MLLVLVLFVAHLPPDVESVATRSSTSSLPPYTDKSSPPATTPTTPTPHRTQSATRTAFLADVTLGLSDGLTVPFALTAGLSALNSSHIVVTGGLAELVAGAISMGLGGYLAASGDATSYASCVSRTRGLVKNGDVEERLRQSVRALTLPSELLDAFVRHVCGLEEEAQVAWLLQADGVAAPGSLRPYVSALTIAAGYFGGGFLPLVPYLLFAEVGDAFMWSCGVMVVALFAFGAGKHWALDGADDEARCIRLGRCCKEGLRMLVLGALAAAVAVGVVRTLEEKARS